MHPPNRQSVNIRLLIALPLLVLITLLIGFVSTTPALSASCPAGYLIDHTFGNGARWEMCWEERAQEGIVFTDIHYTSAGGTRRKVIESAGLAQIDSLFDDNALRLHQVTDAGAGLGGSNMDTLAAADCPTGTLLADAGKNVLCQELVARGYSFKYYSTQTQLDAIKLFSVSQISEQVYVVQWSFLDNGIIEPAIGLSGQLERIGTDSTYGWPLDAANAIGVGQTLNYSWRIDFDLGGNGANDRVEEIALNPADSRQKKEMQITQLTSETERVVDPDTKRSWRVVDSTITNADGHAISYHLEPLHTGHNYVGPASEPWTAYDIFFTVDTACEQFLSQNPTTGGCGDDVTDFTNGESIDSADVVMWYTITRHDLPRDEDEAYRNVRWDSFQLVPRDWTAESE